MDAPDNSKGGNGPTMRADKKGLKRVLIFCGALIVLFVGYKELFVSTPGYCSKQGRILSDDEYFERVVGGLMKSGLMKLDASDTGVKAYLENHRGCCHVDRSDTPVIDRGPFGSDGVEVSVVYEMSEHGRRYYGGKDADAYYQKGGKETYYIFIAGLSGCGAYIETTGMSTTKPEWANK